ACSKFTIRPSDQVEIVRSESACESHARRARSRRVSSNETVAANDVRRTWRLFSLPDKCDMADMLREDLAAARRAWLRECLSDLDAYIAREQTDFLAGRNHAGEVLDFHALRHTCGAWLVLSGANAKIVQVVMRHSTIKLTLDTYGHLLPGQEAD